MTIMSVCQPVRLSTFCLSLTFSVLMSNTAHTETPNLCVFVFLFIRHSVSSFPLKCVLSVSFVPLSISLYATWQWHTAPSLPKATSGARDSHLLQRPEWGVARGSEGGRSVRAESTEGGGWAGSESNTVFRDANLNKQNHHHHHPQLTSSSSSSSILRSTRVWKAR